MANCIRCGRQLSGFSFNKLCPWCVQHEKQQRGELPEDAPQPVIRQPWVRHSESTITLTHIIFGINAAVFLGMALGSGSVMDFPGEELVRWGANFGPFTLSGEWWRLLTNTFLHGGLFHIAINMWCLWDLGALCESLYGPWTFVAIYLACGLGGSLASVAWHPTGISAGASGAIFGLAGALLAGLKLGEFSVPRSALTGVTRSVGIFVVYSLVAGLIFGGRTDNAAHIGGLISGVIVGAIIAVLAPQQEHAARRLAIFAALFLVLALGAVQIAHYYGAPLRFGRVPFVPQAELKTNQATAQEAKLANFSF
jgi:membrane associated rhomboid family serine protease